MSNLQAYSTSNSFSNNALAFRTNGKSIEVVANGQSAKILTNVLAICLLAFTVKAVLS